MSAQAEYNLWLNNGYFDEETRQELKDIAKKEIDDRFFGNLKFGTGGLRGVMGAGINRMNRYTVRKASQGLANYLLAKDANAKEKGIVIAYDSRHKSQDFAFEAARVFAGNGIKAYIFDELRPTPELSFAVRYKKACAGIVITASHNPKEYNGYKVYGDDGGQLGLYGARQISMAIKAITDWTTIKILDTEEAIKNGLIDIIGCEEDEAYISRVKGLSINPDIVASAADSFRIIYTPLHGAGNKLVRRILFEIGLKGVRIVKEQEEPDPEFSTVVSPNPENREAFAMAIELAKKENADLIIGTDPDCDRIGVVVPDCNGEYVVLTGNQIGLILLEYILSQKKMKRILPQNGFVVKTIVSTQIANTIARSFDVELVEVLTGFKFIGEQIKALDDLGDKDFLFGFEESNGYLAGSFVRDKDGVIASMLIAEAAVYYQSKGMTLLEGLNAIFKKYGYGAESIDSFILAGKDGMDKINYVMKMLRENKQNLLGDFMVLKKRDYLDGMRYQKDAQKLSGLVLPKSDVLFFELHEDAWLCIRPSGTEPKLKIYCGVTGTNMEKTQKKLKALQGNVLRLINRIITERKSSRQP